MTETGSPLDALGEDMLAAAYEIELVVVGAHLSGMALNNQLIACGGQLARSAHTTADYRLYALTGGPPHRPGLLRVEDGTGKPIDVEVWALKAAAFGLFVSRIPPPLGVGTVRLADGTTPKGFLVEAAGLAGAADISEFGGWRRYAEIMHR
jgi:allophanate hydrolase